MNERELLFALLRSEVCAEPIEACVFESLTPAVLEKLYNLASSHDYAHLVGHVLIKNNALGDDAISTKFRNCVRHTVYRIIRMEHEYDMICRLLEENGIPFIPLKGAVLSGLYPESWMRTSCDIDILVQKEHVETATELFVEKLHYTKGKRTYHDLSLYTPSHVHLELHHLVMDEAESKEFGPIFSRIWEEAYLKPGFTHQFCMPDEIFYFYHVAHMVKHFRKGGCGIKPVLDLWILNHKVEFDREARDRMLADGGLLVFEKAALALSEAWFANKAHDSLTIQLEQYILAGGSYGNLKNTVSFSRVKEGNRFCSVLAMVFPAYEVMRYHYPILQKAKWALPVFYFVRCVQFLFSGGAKRLIYVLKANRHMSDDDISAAGSMIERLGL